MPHTTQPTPAEPFATPVPVVVRVYARSDVGLTREHNEDAFIVADLSGAEPMRFSREVTWTPGRQGTLFMVADGMGGAAAGEIASEMAVDIVLRELAAGIRSEDGSSPVEPTRFARAIRSATETANAAIHKFAGEHPEYRGMGTTATIAGLLGDTLYVAQVGDSRAYLLRDGQAHQITKDQSLMQKLVEAGEISPEEAEQSERRNIILQALGPEGQVKVDLTHQQVRRGDVLLLCSDGLSALVRTEAIAEVLRESADLEEACERLIALANSAGGPDNITVVAARFEGETLPTAAASDDVGHRVFRTGESTPADGPILVSLPAGIQPMPPLSAMPGPHQSNGLSAEDRRRRGLRILRVLSAVGAVIAGLVIWQLLTRVS